MPGDPHRATLRVDDPRLSPEANRLLAEELREAVGDAAAQDGPRLRGVPRAAGPSAAPTEPRLAPTLTVVTLAVIGGVIIVGAIAGFV